jgi:hypothetical protein
MCEPRVAQGALSSLAANAARSNKHAPERPVFEASPQIGAVLSAS